MQPTTLGRFGGWLLTAALAAVVPATAMASPLYSVASLGPLNAQAINASGQVAGTIGTNLEVYSGGTFTNLGSLFNNTSSYVRGINSAGQVAGTAQYSYYSGYGGYQYQDYAFRSSGSYLQSLGSLGGSTTETAAINGSGQVTGSSATSSGTFHAFIATGGGMTDLGTLGGSYSFGEAINDSGMVTGYSGKAGDQTSAAFLYSAGRMTDLGSLSGGNSLGLAINAAGQVAGVSSLAGNAGSDPVLFSNGQVIDLGSFGGNFGEATGINARGQVIGSAATAGGQDFGFFYDGAAMNRLSFGGSGSEAAGLNDKGQVVGGATDPSGNDHAFLYSAGVMSKLDDMITASDPLAGAVSFSEATAINNSGQIIAYGCTASGATCGDYLLTPLSDVSIPEPMSLGLFGSACALASFARRRRVRAGGQVSPAAGLC